MREIALRGSPVCNQDYEQRVWPEGTGERGQEKTGEEELSSLLGSAELPMLNKKQASGAGGRWGEDEHCLSVK